MGRVGVIAPFKVRKMSFPDCKVAYVIANTIAYSVAYAVAYLVDYTVTSGVVWDYFPCFSEEMTDNTQHNNNTTEPIPIRLHFAEQP